MDGAHRVGRDGDELWEWGAKEEKEGKNAVRTDLGTLKGRRSMAARRQEAGGRMVPPRHEEGTGGKGRPWEEPESPVRKHSQQHTTSRSPGTLAAKPKTEQQRCLRGFPSPGSGGCHHLEEHVEDHEASSVHREWLAALELQVQPCFVGCR